jgi:ERF superfamily
MKLIATAMVKAQKEFGPALKTSTNPHFRSRYADLSACVEAVIDALNNNGIALIQKCSESDTGVNVETLLLHESGESLSCGVLHVPASKQDPQGYGSALTYARRYSLMAACGIAPEDDDGNAASRTARNPLDSLPKLAGVPIPTPAPKVDLNAIKEDLPDSGKNTTLPTPGSVRLQIPGKDPIECKNIEEFISQYNTVADKVANSKLALADKQKKLLEFNTLNKQTIELLNPMQMVIMTSAKQNRKKVLDGVA